MTTWAVLERHFDGLSAEEVDRELAGVPARGATPASAAAASYLADHGGPDLDEGAERGDVHRRRVLTAARTLAELVGSALTLDQTAELLGVSRSRISHRLAEGSLWAFTVQGRRYVPRWQLTDDGHPLPGLALVVSAVPGHLHPLALETFMTTAREDFDQQTPAGWLASGGDPAVVADWLAGMAYG